MQHYVCTGDCGNETERPGVCQSAGCSHEGQPLVECRCDDGIHDKILSPVDSLDVESMDDQDEF